MNPNIKISKASFEDQHWKDIRAIRDVVFVEEQAVSPEEEYDEFENTSRHFLALLDGVPAGTARWRRTENGIKLERFAVKKEFRGFGVGKALVDAVLSDVNPGANAGTRIYLHAQLHAIPFYAGSGFEAFGEEFIEADIRHRKMQYTKNMTTI